MLRAHAKADLPRLVDAIVAQERLAMARALRLVDDAPAIGRQLAALLHGHQKPSWVIGVTGNPGAGKSTVVNALIAAWRAMGKRVAVLAVDPSSPFSGGAILGDRIRMNRHFADDGVFIRSMATRGTLGGLSRATFDSVRICGAAGFDIIMVETVGVGQDEVDIARLADSTLVVLVPGMGDDVQAIKAGILEIADVFLINKADKEGVPALEKSLRQMMSLVPAHGLWEPPVVKSVAATGEGIDKLIAKLDTHRDYLNGPDGAARRRMQKREVFDRLLDSALVDKGRSGLGAEVQKALDRVADHDSDPYVEVLSLLGEAKP